MPQLSLFTADRLPKKPYCSDGPGQYGTHIRTLAHAIRHRYIQPNAPHNLNWLGFDIDREGAAFAWEDGVVAEPNITVVNPENGHAHLLYALDTPVHRHETARLRPLRFAMAIEDRYHAALGACDGYKGNLCKNPLHSQWRVKTGPTWAYDLPGLAEYISADEMAAARAWTCQVHVVVDPERRNCSLFDLTRHWAYRNVNRTEWVSFDVWHWAVLSEAEKLSTVFANDPLPYSEIKSLARSIARWCWRWLHGRQADYIALTHTSKIQAIRGQKSGESRRRGTLLEDDREPWVAMGISRRKWYSLQKSYQE